MYIAGTEETGFNSGVVDHPQFGQQVSENETGSYPANSETDPLK